MDNYVYKFGDKLYINLTNKCTNACVFCVRNGAEGVGESALWLEKEPTAAEVKDALVKMDFQNYGEIVFCGFGEPIFKLDEILEIGKFLKAAGKRVRLNTNGHGNLIHGRDITSELSEAVDIISISLNASGAEGYQDICKSRYGEAAFGAMLEFARLCVPKFKRTVLSVVDTIGSEEIEKCRRICEGVGAEFRVRSFM